MAGPDPRPVFRCAIYTRKSTEEGLDREVNSLEAQRDTCSAYVRSQRHKGWVELPKRYDDGGWSGANLVRPALQDLLTDIEAGRVDVVVIYKIDRLSRSLLDFVRLIDTLERFKVSFVSITQAFDTSDSMGRLVLNVLLTFAQFERELLSDRLRDRFATLKRRGKWTGGKTPFGYAKVEKKLVEHVAEAAVVRDIFARYPLAVSGNQLLQELRAEGVRNKVFVARDGRQLGGHLLGPGLLHRILTNPLYLGFIDYKGEWYPGEHPALVTREQWDRVQAKRALRHECQIPRGQSGALLKGLLFDSHGRRMHPDGQVREGRRWDYYSTELSRDAKRQHLKVIRVNAGEVEVLTVTALRALLCDRPRLSDALAELGILDASIARALKAGPKVARWLDGMERERLASVLKCVVRRAELDREKVRLMLSCFELDRLLAWDGVGLLRPSVEIPGRVMSRIYIVDAPAALVRETRRLILPIPPRTADALRPDPRLLKLLEEAKVAREAVYANREKTVAEVAREFRRGASYFSRLIQLNYLAPDIVAAIMDGLQPPGFTRRTLLEASIPMEWDQQRLMFGFPAWPKHGLSMSLTARNHAPRAGGGLEI